MSNCCGDKLHHALYRKIISRFSQTNDLNLRETHSNCEHGTQIVRISEKCNKPFWYNGVMKWIFVLRLTKVLYGYVDVYRSLLEI